MELFGEVYDTTELIEEIQTAPEDSVLTINSPGGSVFEGLQLVNAIRNSEHKITAKVEVMAASIAAVVAMACDSVQISKNDIVMFHNCWTITAGNKEELQNDIEAMKAIDTVLHNIITEHCNDETMSDRIDAGEVWLTGEEVAELFDNVELVDAPEKADKLAAKGSLAELISHYNALMAEKEEPEEEPQEEPAPEEEPEEENEEPKAYVVSPELLALLARAERLE